MQLRTLWSVIIKIIGLYCAISVVNIFIVLLSSVSVGMGKMMVGQVLILFTEFTLAFIFINRTDEVINRLKLVSSIEEKALQFTFETKRVLRLAIAVIGLFNLSQAIPELFFGNSTTQSLLFSISKIAIALLMILKNDELEQLFFKNKHNEPSNRDSGLDV